MEKKKYIAPQCKIIPLPHVVHLLAGSSNLGMSTTPVDDDEYVY